MKHRYSARLKLTLFIFTVPSLVLFVLFFVYPMIQGVRLSFFDWNGIAPTMRAIRLGNYGELFGDSDFGRAALNNVVWAFEFVLGSTLIGLLLAVLLDLGIRGESVIKTIIYFPLVVSFPVLGAIWTWIYEPQGGLLNSTLRTLGLGFIAKPWLADKNVALLSVAIAGIWRQVGFCMVYFAAGLRGIPREMTDSARIDGAGTMVVYFRIIFPLLSYVFGIVITLTLIQALRAFSIIYVMTAGGPDGATTNLAYFTYIEAFHYFKMGYGSASATILMLVVIALSYPIIKRMLATIYEY